MAPDERRIRPAVLWPALAALIAAAALLWRAAGGGDAAAPPPPDVAAPTSAPAAEPHPAPAPRSAPEPEGAPSADPATDPSEGPFDPSALAWSNVDLDAVREALPDNSYWERSVPTRDPEVLRAREEERAYWNEQYGRVLSNTATEAEVRDYYAHRQRIASDAVELSSHLLDHYGDVLPQRDVGLLELARTLNLARLEELPRNLADALRRREAHERTRREWLAQQRLFEDGTTNAE